MAAFLRPMTDHDAKRLAQARADYDRRVAAVTNIRSADWYNPLTCYMTKLERISRDSLDSLLKELGDAGQTKSAP